MASSRNDVIIRLEEAARVYIVGVESIHALNGVSLEIRRNEYVSIMGQSGSGKSTMMNVLGCLDRATSGKYFLDGQDTTTMSDAELARARNERIGFVFQPNQMSGGEKQRVAIARALINHPSILLADEPTGNLDTHTSEEIMRLFDRLHTEGQTIIMVTHEDDIARHARRIIRMRDGQIMSDLPVQQDQLTRGRSSQEDKR
jgi:putative ABC transport system ATP-binding protein